MTSTLFDRHSHDPTMRGRPCFFEVDRASGVFSNEIYAGMVITLTTSLSPFVMKWFYERIGETMPIGSQTLEVE